MTDPQSIIREALARVLVALVLLLGMLGAAIWFAAHGDARAALKWVFLAVLVGGWPAGRAVRK